MLHKETTKKNYSRKQKNKNLFDRTWITIFFCFFFRVCVWCVQIKQRHAHIAYIVVY